MQRSVPLASAGFSRLPASIAPPDAAPAPTSEWISSMKRIAFGFLLEPIEHLLDALLEVAAIARAGDQRAEIERVDRRVLQRLRHVALMDAQRQPFGQRRLADARLADEQRVVLPAPAQHLHHALELERAADQRIDLPRRGARDQVGRKGLERIGRRRAAAGSPPSGAAAGSPFGAVRDDAQQRQPIDALRAQEVRGVALLLLQHEHEQAAAVDLLGARHRGVHHGLLDDAIEAERRLGLDRRRRRAPA